MASFTQKGRERGESVGPRGTYQCSDLFISLTNFVAADEDVVTSKVFQQIKSPPIIWSN